MAQGATSQESADTKLRRLLARKRSLGCADVETGGSALPCESAGRKGTLEWRRPAVLLDIDGPGVSANFQSPTSMVGRYCARKRVEPRDIRSPDRDPAPGLDLETDVWPSSMSGRDVAGDPRAVKRKDPWNVVSDTARPEPSVDVGTGPPPRFADVIFLVIGSTSFGGSFV